MTIWSNPRPQEAGDPKNCAIHASNSHTKSGWIWKKKVFGRPNPHSTPKSHPWGMTQATEWKSPLICFISFNCEKTHKVWFKIFWNRLCDWDLMIFDLLTPPQGPRGWGQKNCAFACAIDVSYSHTKSGWISEKKILGGHSTPHGAPKSDPLGMTQATE